MEERLSERDKFWALILKCSVHWKIRLTDRERDFQDIGKQLCIFSYYRWSRFFLIVGICLDGIFVYMGIINWVVMIVFVVYLQVRTTVTWREFATSVVVLSTVFLWDMTNWSTTRRGRATRWPRCRTTCGAVRATWFHRTYTETKTLLSVRSSAVGLRASMRTAAAARRLWNQQRPVRQSTNRCTMPVIHSLTFKTLL